MKATVYQGRHITLKETAKGLVLTMPDPASIEEAVELNQRPRWTDQHVLVELMQDHTGNEWEWLNAEDIGALTGCPFIIGRDVELTDSGDVICHGPVYWFERYAIDSPLERLIEDGQVVFEKVEAA